MPLIHQLPGDEAATDACGRATVFTPFVSAARPVAGSPFAPNSHRTSRVSARIGCRLLEARHPAGLIVLTAVLFWPGSYASGQVLETIPPKTVEAAALPVADPLRIEPPPAGPVYTWSDGRRVQRIFLQEDLVVRRGAAFAESQAPPAAEAPVVARTTEGAIVSVEAGVAAPVGQTGPVFRSQAGGLMTLPGGVLLAFDSGRSPEEVEEFFLANGISSARTSTLPGIPNGFLIETEPGFPSLELANALAEQAGVRLSSPNWWQEFETR